MAIGGAKRWPGGSIQSIGPAVEAALTGQACGEDTFFGHLHWGWAILIGYFAAIASHFWINGHLF